MKVFFLRHQAGGVLHEHPFAARPTEAQLAPLRAMCAWRHGEKHPRSGQPYWSDVVAVDVLGPGDVPHFEPPTATSTSSGHGSGSFGDLKAHGVGRVRNPRG